MMRKRVLFYIEPVIYCDDPGRLDGWLHFFSLFAARSAESFVSAVATSATKIADGESTFDACYSIDPVSFLAPHDFDRVHYSRDICQGDGRFNPAVIARLQAIKDDFDPDIIISCTDNSYLKRIFGHRCVMFMELGPLPRHGMKTSVYVDPYGHQVGSALDWFGKSQWTHAVLDEYAEEWESKWLAGILRNSVESGIADWLKEARSGKKVVLLALQPRDWLTYEGVGPQIDPVSLVRRVAYCLDEEWIVVPQWHGSDKPPSDALIADIMKWQPNIVVPPAPWHVAQSEILLPYVERVTTISSNIAIAGSILGTQIEVIGRSKPQALNSFTGRRRSDVLAFLTSRYCRPLDDFLYNDGAFADHVLRLEKDPEWLFQSDGIDPQSIMQFLE